MTVATLALHISGGLPQTSSANAAVLSPEQIAAFEETLDRAQTSRERLGRESGCLSAYLSQQQDQSAERERALLHNSLNRNRFEEKIMQQI
ncbi:hypothetical protein GOZ94_03050 [Agrobacterium vitis]|uniref:hypothetical protein n=1 Tax=Agrobacterium vitis TaxID=373 RepID=UPI0012E978A4|nr:hypothetical protein [Agrobacterium vitis]MVA17925.1 hypothetical protein [Agrobacterium vitis]